MTIGERIKEKRLEKNMSLDDLAKVANVARQTIFKYENNIITNIPTDKIEHIADALNTSPGYLMGWEESNKIFSVKFPEWYSLMQLSETDIHNATIKQINEVKKKFENDKDIISLCSTFSHFILNVDNLMNNYAISNNDKTYIESDFPKAIVRFYDLNDEGRELATNYIEMLLSNDKYRRAQEEIIHDDERRLFAFRFQDSNNKNE